PMAAQAYNYLAVIKDARKNGETIHFAPHSMASLVMAKMIHLEPELFKDSHIFMLAPAGTIEDETFGSLAKDWFGMIKSESNKNRPVEFPDPRGVTAIASFKSLARNPLRSVREVRSMINERINYQEIIDKVGELIVVSYVQDEMFPEARLAPMLEKAGVRWVSPCDLRGMLNGRINFGGEGSTHDYEQFSPSVVAGCLIKLLSPDLKPQSLDV
ncbi:hypothetical protein KY385_04825, partial [Candidatus Parcubacteria bacterium]|nr:hypothetical protein [Candidatus Parcubacteria bacterium]